MKGLLVVTVLFLGTAAEPPAPYPPSGWRPSGPAFVLPQQQSRPQQYLSPLDPRNPSRPGPDYNPEEDVSVQGLPVVPQQEAQPLFQVSPITGQQYSGPGFNEDLKNLGSFDQPQFEQRQLTPNEKTTMQRQWDEASAKSQGQPLPPREQPGQFARTTEAPTTISSKDLNEGETLNEQASAKLKEKVSVEVTKQNVQEYPGELFLSSLAQLRLQPQFIPVNYQPSQKQVVGFDAPTHFSALPSVLAQQNLPQQFQNPALIVPQNEPVFLPQQQLQGSYQPQIQTQLQPEPVFVQSPAQFQPNFNAQSNPDAVSIQQPAYQPQSSYPQFQSQPQSNPDAVSIQQPAYQPQGSYPQFLTQPQSNPDAVSIQQPAYQPQGSFPQFQAQPQSNPDAVSIQQPAYQPQGSFPQFQAQPQSNPDAVSIQQPAYQPQGSFPQFQAQPQSNPDAVSIQQPAYQPQGSFPQFQAQPVLIPQNFNQQPQNQYSKLNDQQFSQQPIIVQQFPQNQYLAPQFQEASQVSPQTQYLQPEVQYSGPQEPQQFQGQDNLQSGLDINQNGNDIDEGQADEEEPDRATAVATAFGARTQPRVNTKYGAPFPVPKVQANPGYYTTTESNAEEVTESGPAIAQATAVANGERRRNSRLRSRKIRPVYAVDQSGRLVLAEAEVQQ